MLSPHFSYFVDLPAVGKASHYHKAGHEECDGLQCQTHRWRRAAKTSRDAAEKKQKDRRTVGHGCCGCFSGSVLAGCCEEWERSNQQVYCRRNSSQYESLEITAIVGQKKKREQRIIMEPAASVSLSPKKNELMTDWLKVWAFWWQPQQQLQAHQNI